MHEIGLDIRARGVESALRALEDGTGSEANKYAGVSGLESSVPLMLGWQRKQPRPAEAVVKRYVPLFTVQKLPQACDIARIDVLTYGFQQRMSQ